MFVNTFYHLISSTFLEQIPFNLIFIGANCDWDFVGITNLSMDMAFLIDVAINFNTAFVNDLGTTIKNHGDISRKYLRSVHASSSSTTL